MSEYRVQVTASDGQSQVRFVSMLLTLESFSRTHLPENAFFREEINTATDD